jgi:hypothetical protein
VGLKEVTGGDYENDEDCHLLGCVDVKFDRSLPAFGGNVLPPSLAWKRDFSSQIFTFIRRQRTFLFNVVIQNV